MTDYNVDLTREYCELHFSGAFHPAFRIVKVYHIFLSIISMFSIGYFCTTYTNQLVFHFNIKILFLFQFTSCFIQAAVLGIFQTHHLITALIAVNPCDVVLSPAVYAIFNIPLNFSNLAMEFSQLLMVVERTLATCLFSCYERTTRAIGIVLAAISAILPGLSCFYMYYGDNFSHPQMSAMATSPNSLRVVNYLFITVTVINFIALLHSIGLYKHNKRRILATEMKDHFILSSRYQLSENETSSKLLWLLSTAQLVLYLFYGIAMYSLRIFLVGPRTAVWQAVTELCYTPPMYCAVLPVVFIMTIKSSQKDRNMKISSLVQMRSTGHEGWDNYQNMLQKQWA